MRRPSPLGTGAILVMVERGIAGYAYEAENDSLASETAILRGEDRTAGRAALIGAVTRHEAAMLEHQRRYLLIDRGGKRLAGSLPAHAAREGWGALALAASEASDAMMLRTLGTRLGDGALLVVGDDISDLQDLRSRLGYVTLLFGIAITLLALGGGYVVGTLFLRRLDRVNKSVERIMGGSLAERLPAIGMSPEFDQLSSNLNRMLDRIEALLEGMRQVSTDIAHDLRTPMTRLRQRLEEMKAANGAVALDREIDGVLAQADQILAIFRALLRIGALESGAGSEMLTPLDLSETAERVFQAYRPVAEDSGHVLRSAIAPGISVDGDADLLAQALTNLVENALTHTPRGTAIELGLAVRGGNAVLWVADDGPGIPEADHGNVRKRFYRLDRSRATPGAGLGLALVEAIAARHGAGFVLAGNGPGLRAEILFGPPAG